MTVFLEECTPFSVLEVEGTLRAPIDMTFRRTVEALLRRGQRRIVLNLARLSDMDAAGIGELMRAYHMTSSAGGVLHITRRRRRVHRLLDVAGVLSVLSPAARDAHCSLRRLATSSVRRCAGRCRHASVASRRFDRGLPALCTR